jgi:acetyl coenzyme A synthetase (ADP forming)-like protein
MQNSLRPFFNPQGVAIIGASSNPNKLSFGIFRNLTQNKYSGKIYPVNPNAKEILGLECFPDVRNIPDPVDLAVSVVASGLTPDVLEACGQRGIRAVTIISGGFREVGPEGIALEERCLAIAKQYGMRLVGPNCVGTMDLHSGLNTTFIYGIPDQGHIGFLSQSGAICGGIVDIVRSKQIGFSNFVSLGNMADVTETDMIEYLSTDPNTRVITLYIEGIQNGKRFLEVAQKVSLEKPILILKAGKTQAGARAVSSHTGSIAGSHSAYQAAFNQSGVIEVDTVADLFDIALAFVMQPIAQGNRTAIVTNSGGPAALASDSINANGLQLANLKEDTRQLLRGKLNPSAQVNNPVDMLGGAEPSDYKMALDLIVNDPQVDLVVPILVPQALINPLAVAQEIVRISEVTKKPMVACFMGDQSVAEARRALHSGGVPMYMYPETTGRVLGALYRYSVWKRDRRRSQENFRYVNVDVSISYLDIAANRLTMGEAETRPLLEAYGIPIVRGEWARNPIAAGQAAVRIGGSVALKVVSQDLIHKTDAGGIRLGLYGEESVSKAYSEMMTDILAITPEARLEGAMVEAMALRGQEVIIGMRRDNIFGPILMFGLGGVYVELFADVAFRIAPFTAEQALEMILETRVGKLLSGYRGSPLADLGAVVDVLLKLGQLALDLPAISEIEINPLVVYPKGQGALALDCRTILKERIP